MCVGEYTNYPEELMLFNFLFKVYASFCVRNQIFFEIGYRYKTFTTYLFTSRVKEKWSFGVPATLLKKEAYHEL